MANQNCQNYHICSFLKSMKISSSESWNIHNILVWVWSFSKNYKRHKTCKTREKSDMLLYISAVLYTLFIDQSIFKFLWGKRDWIKRKSVINKLEEGGLSMIDLKTQICAIKAAWTSRIITDPDDHLWSYLRKLYLSKFGNDYFIVKSTVSSSKMFSSLKTIPEFYQDVILSYNKSKILSNENFHENIKNRSIWCNKYIKFKGKTLLFKRWIEDGIVMLKNLRLNNGILNVEFLANITHDKDSFTKKLIFFKKHWLKQE